MKVPLIVLALILAVPASAAVYKSVLPDGRVIYSDQPPSENAAPAHLPPIQLIPAAPVPPPPEPAEAQETTRNKAAAYRSIGITSPAHDSTLRDNAGTVVINVALDPPLLVKAGHHIAIYLDGTLIGENSTGTLTLNNVDRGTHTLNASVNSKQGQAMLTSPTVTFHLQRVSSRN
ncbi:MAG: DUF4124 domain-containing protein [Pseudomonadota bacterium]